MEKSKQRPLTNVVEAVRQSPEFRQKFEEKPPICFEHVVEAAQSFVAACAVRQHPSRSCWLICPDARPQEGICNDLLNWGIGGGFFPSLGFPALKGPGAITELL